MTLRYNHLGRGARVLEIVLIALETALCFQAEVNDVVVELGGSWVLAKGDGHLDGAWADVLVRPGGHERREDEVEPIGDGEGVVGSIGEGLIASCVREYGQD